MTDVREFAEGLRDAAIKLNRSAGQVRRQEAERPLPERDCGRLGHIFEVLCDLDKIPRIARCSACHREWAFAMVMEIRRIP